MLNKGENHEGKLDVGLSTDLVLTIGGLSLIELGSGVLTKIAGGVILATTEVHQVFNGRKHEEIPLDDRGEV